MALNRWTIATAGRMIPADSSEPTRRRARTRPRSPMNRSLFSSLLLSLTPCAHAQIPAFPGAEGFGAYATGGRGGDVYYVTNLNNNGAGSLRVGLDTAPPEGRTIVFAVSGYIPVVSDTNFDVPSRVTIAGQTAPGDGVGLQGGRMLISGSDVVMRHFRIRHGKNGTGGDCLNIASSASNTIIDHVSMMFSTDENFSFFSNAINNFTMQSSSSTWGMERHSAGGLWDLQNGSCIDSLWAHHRTRNPKARPYGLLEWINNVTFHWRNEGFIMGDSETPADWKTNAIGNYYISIDDPDEGFGVKNTAFTKARVSRDGVPNFSLFLDDTLFDNNDNGILDGTDQGYGIVAGAEFTPGDPTGSNRYYRADSPFPGASGPAAVTIDDPLTAYKKVISSVGPLRLDANYSGPVRDELDSLLIDSVVNQYSVLVQKDGKIAGEDPARSNNGEQHLADAYGITNNGFGTLNSTVAPQDGDLDGMPDVWEHTLGWDAGTQDHNVAMASSGGFVSGLTFFPAGTPAGYTRLEEYLHFKAIPHASIAAGTILDVDLRRYTEGFSASPVFTISNVSNGMAEILPDGHTARFTPDTGHSGRCRFDFTVTDAEGSSWTQTFAVLASGELAPPAAPSGLVATAMSSYRVDLSWVDNANNEWGFRIERSSDNVNFTEVGNVTTDTATFSDDSLAPGTAYQYRVLSYNGIGDSDDSGTAAAVTPAGPPAAPSALSAAPGNARVTLSWDSTAGADRYRVKRSLTFGGPYSEIGTVTGPAYVDTGAANGTTYHYVVAAENSHGAGGNSNQGVATPTNAVTYPAEDADFGNGTDFETSNGGFNGSGYVNFPGSGGFLQFDDVDGGDDGAVTLRFRYALGAAGARTGVLVVNGVSQGITFESTGSWSTWFQKELAVTLNPGAGNIIRLESNGEDLANIDELSAIAGDSGSAPTPVYQVNSGGPAASPFAADDHHSGGGDYGTGDPIDTSNASGPAPAAVYQTERNGNFSYVFPGLNAGGIYTVRLHFAEIFWSDPGSRAFDVAINGTLVLDDFDIVAEAGAANRALVREFAIAADGGGELEVQYTTVTDNAVSSGLEVIFNAASAAPSAPTGLTAQGADQRVDLSWNPTPGAESYVVHRSDTSGGGYSIMASGVSSASYTDTTVPNGTTYYYVVSASNDVGESPLSGEVSATAVALPPPHLHLRSDEQSGVLAADSTGNGRDGTLVNGAAFAAGRVNNAIRLDGTNDHVTLEAGVVDGLTDFTLAAWVLWDDAGVNWQRVFDFGTGSGQADRYMFLTPRNSFNGLVRFAITSGGPGGEQVIDGIAALPSGVWTHVAVTLTGSSGTLYLNGSPVGSNPGMSLTPASLGSTTQNYLGRSQFAADPYFDGLIDEFQVHARALEASEIAELADPPAAPTGLVATGGEGRVDLSWNPVAGADRYTVRRATTSGGPFTPVAADLPGPAFLDAAVTVGTTYHYVVTALDGIAESGHSAEASATPLTALQAWRLEYFETTDNTGDAADDADPDGDGVSNIDEFEAGTDPTDSTSRFVITDLARTGGGCVVSFPTVSGKTYRVEWSTSMQPGSWEVVRTDGVPQEAIAGTGGTVQVTDTGTLPAIRFYRAAVE